MYCPLLNCRKIIKKEEVIKFLEEVKETKLLEKY